MALLNDTDPKALEVFLDLQRQKSMGEKFATVIEMTEMLIHLSEAGVRLLYPNADEHEIQMRAAARRYGREIMIKAFGWDPELH